MIKLYTSDGCPKCKTLKNRLNKQGIEFEEIDGTLHVELLRGNGFTSFPVVRDDDGNFYDFRQALSMTGQCKNCGIR